jgi:hypothetical protein
VDLRKAIHLHRSAGYCFAELKKIVQLETPSVIENLAKKQSDGLGGAECSKSA